MGVLLGQGPERPLPLHHPSQGEERHGLACHHVGERQLARVREQPAEVPAERDPPLVEGRVVTPGVPKVRLHVLAPLPEVEVPAQQPAHIIDRAHLGGEPPLHALPRLEPEPAALGPPASVDMVIPPLDQCHKKLLVDHVRRQPRPQHDGGLPEEVLIGVLRRDGVHLQPVVGEVLGGAEPPNVLQERLPVYVDAQFTQPLEYIVGGHVAVALDDPVDGHPVDVLGPGGLLRRGAGGLFVQLLLNGDLPPPPELVSGRLHLPGQAALLVLPPAATGARLVPHAPPHVSRTPPQAPPSARAAT